MTRPNCVPIFRFLIHLSKKENKRPVKDRNYSREEQAPFHSHETVKHILFIFISPTSLPAVTQHHTKQVLRLRGGPIKKSGFTERREVRQSMCEQRLNAYLTLLDIGSDPHH